MNVQKKQFIVYFAIYLIAQVMYIYINAYLPIYFTYASSIDITDLGIFLFVSYSFMFVKPLLAIFFDLRSKKNGSSNTWSPKKKLLFLGAIGAILSFILILLNLELVLMFTIFLGINLAFVSLMDVTIDKIILKNSLDETLKNKNAFFVQFGAITGAILVNVYYFFIMDDRTSLTPWALFFIVGVVTVISVFPSLFLLKESNTLAKDGEKEKISSGPVNYFDVLLMGVFIFLAYGTYLYEWVLEPWAVFKLESDSLFATVMIVFIILNVISLLIAGKFARKFNKKKLLMFSAFISGILTIIAPFVGIFSFLILIGIVQLIAGFYLITLTTSMFEISHEKVLAFQLIASFAILSKVILAPIGLFLWDIMGKTAFLAGECIIMFAGLLQILAVIPLYFIKFLS